MDLFLIVVGAIVLMYFTYSIGYWTGYSAAYKKANEALDELIGGAKK